MHTKPQVVFFVHIPKTAGTALHNNLFHHIYSCNEIEKPTGMRSFLWVPKKIRFIGGHMPYGSHRFFPHRCYPTYITILRDPVDRVVSYYYFVRQSKSKHYTHPDYNLISRLSMEQYCRLSKFRNVQTRQLGGYLPYRLHGINTLYLGRFWAYSCASRNLTRNTTIFGLQEYFSESVELIADMLGVKFQKKNQYRKVKVTKNRQRMCDVQQEVTELIREQNKEDIILYREAKALFLSRCKERGIALS
jgi:hypothetical protein